MEGGESRFIKVLVVVLILAVIAWMIYAMIMASAASSKTICDGPKRRLPPVCRYQERKPHVPQYVPWAPINRRWT